MADTKASAFTLATALTDDDTFPVIEDQDGTPLNRQITWANFKTALFGAWASYTPAWTSTGTAPALGNGTFTGRYVQAGKLVFFEFDLTFGSTTTFGTGTYRFSLPVAGRAQSTNHGLAVMGYAEDAGVQGYGAWGAQYISSTTITLLTHLVGGIGQSVQFTPTQPFTWASGDFIRVHGFYEAA